MAAVRHDPLLSLLLVSLCVGGAVWGSPKCQWPMEKKTVLKDVQDDSNTGTMVHGGSGGGGGCPYLVEDPASTGSFYYNGKGSSVAAFRIPSGDFEKYGFTLWVKPLPSLLTSSSTVDVVLFEYRAGSWNMETGNFVTRVYAQVIPGGKVKLTLEKKLSHIFTTMVSRVPLSSTAFSSVVFAVNADENKLHVTIDEEVNETTSGANVHPLRTPGRWRIGEFITTPPNDKRFEGKITCASFFDYYVTTEKRDEYKCTSSDYSSGESGESGCSFSAEPQIDPNGATTTAATTTVEEVTSPPLTTETASSTAAPTSDQTSPVSHTPSPRYFWPIDNVTRGYDVMSGAAPLTSPHDLGCLRVGGAVSLNGGATVSNLLPLLLDGSSRSSFSLRVDASALGSANFTAVLFVTPLAPCEGKVWTFASSAHSSSGVGVSRVEVRLEANCSVVVEAWNSGAADSPCGKVVTDAGVLAYDAATMLRVEKGAEDLTVRVGQALWWTAKHSCDGGCGASCDATGDAGAGSLRVGERFRGSLVCLAVFPEVLPPASLEEDEYLAQCVDGYGSSVQVPASVYLCDATPPELQRGRFRLVARDAVPNAATTSTLVPMAALPTTAAVRCAAGCLLTKHCRSFALRKSAAGQPLPCQLYDFVTDHGLVSSPGRNYYEIID